MADYPSIAIITVYLGCLPPYFDLWLNSCRYNTNFHWHIFTDCEWQAYDIPKNIHIHQYDLNKFITNASSILEVDLDFSAPYKLCDFKPAYGLIFKEELRHYEFWGHCDLDMIFGNLLSFIPPDFFKKYNKIFSVGHFTLYRNSQIANTMFMRNHPVLDWKTILTDPIHKGFDEHIGVNRYWHHYKEPFFEDESIIADIRPHYYAFEVGRLTRNYRRQVFFFENGKIFQGYYQNKKWNTSEFMYIHFQKRKFTKRTARPYSDSFFISPKGFIEKEHTVPSVEEVRALNPICYLNKWSELKFRIKQKIKTALNR